MATDPPRAAPAGAATDPLVLLLVGAESLLADRAEARVVAAARRVDPDTEVTEVAAGELGPGGLDELVSPSLFTASRVALLRDLQDASPELAARLAALASHPVPDVRLVLRHPGGVKGKAVLATLRKAGVAEIECEPITRPDEQVAFVLAEVANAGGAIDEGAARRLVEAVGADLRALAAAAAQLAADAEGLIDATVVGTYFEGRAEVKGWTVADRAVEGRTAQAVEQLRWAMETGTDPVLVTSALATALRGLIRLQALPQGVRDADAAREVAVPPWKIRTLRGQLRGWTPGGLARALQSVAVADAQVKGASNDPALALTRAVLAVGDARREG